MNAPSRAFDHENLYVAVGTRTGLTLAIAIHSTVRGPAIGGCRMRTYPSWREAVDDALHLSRAMSYKNALADLDFGGGKAVICLPTSGRPRHDRADALLDIGELIDSLAGRYLTGPDVGTTPDDMRTVFQATNHVIGRPTDIGGPGGTADPTAAGVCSCIAATLQHLYGSAEITDRTIVIAGLGQVGTRIAQRLADAGATLTVTDIDPTKQRAASDLGAEWVEPELAHQVPADIFVPAGFGGVLTERVTAELAARAVVGPANNQLGEDASARHMEQRGILYAPDFVVNAGAAIYLAMRSGGATQAAAMSRVDGIGATLLHLYVSAQTAGITPLAASIGIAKSRLVRR